MSEVCGSITMVEMVLLVVQLYALLVLVKHLYWLLVAMVCLLVMPLVVSV